VLGLLGWAFHPVPHWRFNLSSRGSTLHWVPRLVQKTGKRLVPENFRVYSWHWTSKIPRTLSSHLTSLCLSLHIWGWVHSRLPSNSMRPWACVHWNSVTGKKKEGFIITFLNTRLCKPKNKE
jgi:hypothetical protein